MYTAAKTCSGFPLGKAARHDDTFPVDNCGRAMFKYGFRKLLVVVNNASLVVLSETISENNRGLCHSLRLTMVYTPDQDTFSNNVLC